MRKRLGASPVGTIKPETHPIALLAKAAVAFLTPTSIATQAESQAFARLAGVAQGVAREPGVDECDRAALVAGELFEARSRQPGAELNGGWFGVLCRLWRFD
jgi:hypothetical protein